MKMTSKIKLPIPWSEAKVLLSGSLEEVGLTSTRSFDLQSARESLLDPELCPCPHHGAEQCTCQYMVFVVHIEGRSPISVELHGYEDRTYLSIVQPIDGFVDEGSLELVQRALDHLVGIENKSNN
jgi:hypothetical protein